MNMATSNPDIMNAAACDETNAIASTLNHKPCNVHIYHTMVTPNTQRQPEVMSSLNEIM